ncbi:unnamed protein product [Caenorhabditis brenneri]
MHELKYDTGLEKKAEEVMSNCKFYKVPYVIIASTDNEVWNKNAFDFTMHPLQTSVGCSEKKKNCVNNGVTIYGICLMGPHSRWNDGDEKIGAPGSQCPGGKTSSDLCNSSSSASFAATVLFLCIFFNFIEKK